MRELEDEEAVQVKATAHRTEAPQHIDGLQEIAERAEHADRRIGGLRQVKGAHVAPDESDGETARARLRASYGELGEGEVEAGDRVALAGDGRSWLLVPRPTSRIRRGCMGVQRRNIASRNATPPRSWRCRGR